MMPTGSHRLLRFLVEAERERRQILLPILRLHSSSVSPSIIDIALPIIGHPMPCLHVLGPNHLPDLDGFHVSAGHCQQKFRGICLQR